ncbi:MAG: class I SAM-dependent methyltransferase [Planctomycetes bacterium]|nr:class I SAM-dependent methyltransferase [Planctomycetota bacterium]
MSVALPAAALRELLGSIDIYLLDQILRGRFDARRALLDAGCGAGRNLRWFLRAGYEVHGVELDARALEAARTQARELVGEEAARHFVPGTLDALPHETARFDAVLLNAVLHFAPDRAHFERWLGEAWRVLRPGGLLFARLASKQGIETAIVPRGDERYLLPDGSERYLVDDERLLELGARLGARLLDPLKTVNVQGLRCMCTWVIEKSAQ